MAGVRVQAEAGMAIEAAGGAVTEAMGGGGGPMQLQVRRAGLFGLEVLQFTHLS